MRRFGSGSRAWLVLGLVILAVVPRCDAATDGKYATESRSPMWLRALLDVRVARTGSAPSWREGGDARVRYGGQETTRGRDRRTGVHMAQMLVEAGALLPRGVTLRAQAAWNADLEPDWPLVIDVYLRREWGDWQEGAGIQAGVMNPPLSLEHRGPAWTPLYTLTPSAGNTWLWEEVRSVGLEGEWWKLMRDDVRLGALGGIGWGPDQLGRLLVKRGWVMSDFMSGLNSDLPVAPGAEPQSVFDERDHRPLVYAWISGSDAAERVHVSAGYLDNLGDLDEPGVWHTRLFTVGGRLHPWGPFDIVAQIMAGDSEGPADDNEFQAFYVLGSGHWRGHRLSVRWDDFRQSDRDGAPFTDEKGEAFTFGYFFEWGLHHRVGFEWILVESERPRGASDPFDDLWQVSYRFRY